MEEQVSYGGQAVLEGVMIRGPKRVAIAVRRSDSGIVVHTREFVSVTERIPWLGLPFLRGVVQLYQVLVLGVDALMYSANQLAESEHEKISRSEMTLTLVLSFIVAILGFVAAPTWAVNLLGTWIRSEIVLNLLEGGLRLALLIGYVGLIARMPDIQRVLEYHGAEHKVIHAFEQGDPLTVERVRCHSILHPRCGTSFLLLVALVSLVLFIFFGWPDFWQRLAIRLGLLPVVAGLGYECIRASARSQSPIWKPVIAPGLWLQRFTTREPDDEQIEVAIQALRSAAGQGSEPAVL